MTPAARNHDLTPAEASELADCEKIIAAGFGTFYSVGVALLRISDGRLYRKTHSTFEEYCREKWGMSARRAYQLCHAAEVVKSLPETTVNNCSQVVNEGQARELGKVPTEKRAKVIEAAQTKAESQGKPVTAAAIKEAALEVCPPAPEPPKADAEFAAALGNPNPATFFAIQQEELGSRILAEASEEQLEAWVRVMASQTETAKRKLKSP